MRVPRLLEPVDLHRVVLPVLLVAAALAMLAAEPARIAERIAVRGPVYVLPHYVSHAHAPLLATLLIGLAALRDRPATLLRLVLGAAIVATLALLNYQAPTPLLVLTVGVGALLLFGCARALNQPLVMLVLAGLVAVIAVVLGTTSIHAAVTGRATVDGPLLAASALGLVVALAPVPRPAPLPRAIGQPQRG